MIVLAVSLQGTAALASTMTPDMPGSCLSDADCSAGDSCTNGTCVPDTSPSGGPCAADSDCSGGELCDEGTGRCLAPINDGTVAVGGDCLEDADCEAGDSCDASTGLCIAGGGAPPAPCSTDGDCTAQEYCQNGYCNETFRCDDGSGNPDSSLCATDQECDASRLVCVPAPSRPPAGAGASCTADSDCSSGVCDADHTCKGMQPLQAGATCAKDTDCASGVCDADRTCKAGGCSTSSGAAGWPIALALLLAGLALRRLRRFHLIR